MTPAGANGRAYPDTSQRDAGKRRNAGDPPDPPEDTEIEGQVVRELSPESRYFRFMEVLRELSRRILSHFTQVDYDHYMALVAVTPCGDREVGAARYIVTDVPAGNYSMLSLTRLGVRISCPDRRLARVAAAL